MPLFEPGQTGLRPRGSYDVKIQYNGEWIKFSMLFKDTDLLLAMAAREGQRNFAEAYRDAVKQNMRDGGKRFGYEPLSDEYIQKKAKYGGITSLFRWGETMVEAVEVMVNAKQTRFMVGIPKGVRRAPYYKGEGNELEVHEYANAIEHGYATKGVYVEPRPVFSDTFKKTMGGIRGLRSMIETSIMGIFAMRGVKVIKRSL